MAGIGDQAQRRLALALGPGGTFGFAHLGVISALLGAGLRIDALAGASTGALFGALYAMEGSTEAIARALNVSPHEILGLFRDRLCLSASNMLGARLKAHFAAARLESLPVPLSVLATDLFTGEEVILREGPVKDAIEASIAIPLIARPVALNGRYLIDGGYGPRGPWTAARETGCDVVVYVSLGKVMTCPPRMRDLARRIARRLYRPARCVPPDQREVFRQTLLMLSKARSLAPDADLVIAPSLSDLNRNSPFVASDAFQRGEHAARRALPALRRLLLD